VGRTLSRTDGPAAPGYVTDVEYTGDFYAHLAPAWLAYIAAINGYAAPRLDGNFTWCELGCGKGVTALALAATHPRGEFHACDFNPPHIEYAERLRRAAGLANARFYATDFAGMMTQDLPPFDFVVLHGVYSWVPETARAEIREFLRRKLKPGGLAMVSYNVLPGWAQLTPLRQLLQAYARDVPGDSLDKARAAFARAKALADAGAAFFAGNPAAAQRLASLAHEDIRYVAHEFLTPHGDPFYFSDVETAMRGCGLAYAGSMSPAENYPALQVPARFHGLVAGAGTRALAETQADFISNATFRRDLYAAQAAIGRAPADLPLERFEGLAYCLLDLPESLPLALNEGLMTFDLRPQEARVRAVHGLLERGPATAQDIARAARLQGAEAAFLIQQLVVSEHIAPCPPERAAPGWMALNSAIIDAGLRSQLQQVPLASRLMATATYAEVALAAMVESAAVCASAEEAARTVLDRLRRHAHPVNRHDASGAARAATDAEVLEYAAATWRGLRDPANQDARRLRLAGLLA